MESIYIAFAKTLLIAWCFVDLDIFENIIQERILIIKQCNVSSTIRNLIKQLPLSLLTNHPKLDLARNLVAKNMPEIAKELFIGITFDDLTRSEEILIRIQIAKIDYPDRKEYTSVTQFIEEFKGDYKVVSSFAELFIFYGKYSEALKLYQNLFENYRNSHVASRIVFLLLKIEGNDSIKYDNELIKKIYNICIGSIMERISFSKLRKYMPILPDKYNVNSQLMVIQRQYLNPFSFKQRLLRIARYNESGLIEKIIDYSQMKTIFHTYDSQCRKIETKEIDINLDFEKKYIINILMITFPEKLFFRQVFRTMQANIYIKMKCYIKELESKQMVKLKLYLNLIMITMAYLFYKKILKVKMAY